MVNKWLVTRNNLPVLKLAALFNDIGKPYTKKLAPDGLKENKKNERKPFHRNLPELNEKELKARK